MKTSKVLFLFIAFCFFVRTSYGVERHTLCELKSTTNCKNTFQHVMQKRHINGNTLQDSGNTGTVASTATTEPSDDEINTATTEANNKISAAETETKKIQNEAESAVTSADNAEKDEVTKAEKAKTDVEAMTGIIDAAKQYVEKVKTSATKARSDIDEAKSKAKSAKDKADAEVKNVETAKQNLESAKSESDKTTKKTNIENAGKSADDAKTKANDATTDKNAATAKVESAKNEAKGARVAFIIVQTLMESDKATKQCSEAKRHHDAIAEKQKSIESIVKDFDEVVKECISEAKDCVNTQKNIATTAKSETDTAVANAKTDYKAAEEKKKAAENAATAVPSKTTVDEAQAQLDAASAAVKEVSEKASSLQQSLTTIITSVQNAEKAKYKAMVIVASAKVESAVTTITRYSEQAAEKKSKASTSFAEITTVKDQPPEGVLDEIKEPLGNAEKAVEVINEKEKEIGTAKTEAEKLKTTLLASHTKIDSEDLTASNSTATNAKASSTSAEKQSQSANTALANIVTSAEAVEKAKYIVSAIVHAAKAKRLFNAVITDQTEVEKMRNDANGVVTALEGMINTLSDNKVKRELSEQHKNAKAALALIEESVGTIHSIKPVAEGQMNNAKSAADAAKTKDTINDAKAQSDTANASAIATETETTKSGSARTSAKQESVKVQISKLTALTIVNASTAQISYETTQRDCDAALHAKTNAAAMVKEMEGMLTTSSHSIQSDLKAQLSAMKEAMGIIEEKIREVQTANTNAEQHKNTAVTASEQIKLKSTLEDANTQSQTANHAAASAKQQAAAATNGLSVIQSNAEKVQMAMYTAKCILASANTTSMWHTILTITNSVSEKRNATLFTLKEMREMRTRISPSSEGAFSAQLTIVEDALRAMTEYEKETNASLRTAETEKTKAATALQSITSIADGNVRAAHTHSESATKAVANTEMAVNTARRALNGVTDLEIAVTNAKTNSVEMMRTANEETKGVRAVTPQKGETPFAPTRNAPIIEKSAQTETQKDGKEKGDSKDESVHRAVSGENVEERETERHDTNHSDSVQGEHQSQDKEHSQIEESKNAESDQMATNRNTFTKPSRDISTTHAVYVHMLQCIIVLFTAAYMEAVY